MKTNQLMEKLPYGAVVTQAWLDDHGVISDKARRLASSGWLVRVGHGAYARASDPLRWEGGVFGLQYGQLPIDPGVWPGGATGLAMAGNTHYLSFTRESVQLFGRPGLRLPRWFASNLWGVDLSYSGADLFEQSEPTDFEEYHPVEAYTIKVSSPERSVLEWLHVLPDELLFGDLVVDTFTGLGNLRPARLQSLLQRCRSVRVKRVFMVLARHAQHAWYARLDTGLIELGKGKRQLWVGGKLDSEFLITVPEPFVHAN